MVDMFATRFNRQLTLYYSSVEDPAAMGVDALSQSWTGMSGYAFPPPAVIPAVLGKLHNTGGDFRIILVAPLWK